MAGLTAEQVEGFRALLARNRKPRVVFTDAAGQIAGQVGQVVALHDPAETDEWVVVRFGRDELPFSPADVAMAPPRGARLVEPPVEPVVSVRPEPEFVIDKPRVVPEPRLSPAPAVAPTSPRAQRKAKTAPKPPPGLTVTLAYGDGEWTVAAQQGSKVLARPYVVRPVEALRFVALVDVPGVREAVEQILAAERAEAESQASRLRAELAEIEARLAELRDTQ